MANERNLPNVRIQGVGEPDESLKSLREIVVGLKHNIEILTGSRKPDDLTAVTWGDLATLNLLLGSASGLSGFREQLAANRTYFVSTSGNDAANNGLTDLTPFRTIQHAVDVACALDLSIYNITIRLAAGTYDEMVTLKSYVGKGPISILGDTVTPANVHIQMTGAGDAIRAGQVLGLWSLSGLKLSATTAGFNGIRAADATTVIQIGSIEFGVANIQASAQFGATIRNSGPTRITGNAGFHYYADNGGTIVDAGTTTTLVGTPTIGNYARIIQQARLIANPAAGVTPFVGGSTGLKFTVDTGGMIFTALSGENFLPGSIPGIATPPGFYS